MVHGLESTSLRPLSGQIAFPFISILSSTIRDRDSEFSKAAIDVLSLVAFLQCSSSRVFLFLSGQSTALNVRVSSGSPHLLHPSLSLCFPTVIDSSLQSLTAAHQHLLRSEETEGVACVSKTVRGAGSKHIDGRGKRRTQVFRGEVCHQDCYFSDSRIYFCSEAPVCCRFMVRGLGEHLIMQLTWVPRFVAMVIAKGA